MKRIKGAFITVIALSLVLPSFQYVATAAAKQNNEKIQAISAPIEKEKEEIGKVTGKDEVVYATLSPTGEENNIYVVNSLNVEKAGKVVDYGNYSAVKNLTNILEIKQRSDKVELVAEKGKFFYQGYLENRTLPWDVSVKYFLNNKEISAADLAGAGGHVEIKIATSIKEQAERTFVENYMIQISVPLENESFQNVEAADGMIANVGKNKQVTFTVMPEKEGNFTLSADVKNFKLDGIDITAIPASISIDEPDVGDMKDDLESLSDAISELNDGVAKLNSGVSELNKGTISLRDGSAQYKNGLNEINSASSRLVESSVQIKNGLQIMSKSLPNNLNVDEKQFLEVTDGFNKISDGLLETVKQLNEFKKLYGEAFTALDNAITAIPNSQLTEEQFAQNLQLLYSSGADLVFVENLIETYKAALTVKAVYEQTSDAFKAVLPLLDGVTLGLEETVTALQLMSKQLSETMTKLSRDLGQLDDLFKAVNSLSTNYNKFHEGLVSYTEGVGEIASSYNEIHKGIEQLTGGSSSLDSGVSELQKGTNELHDETSDLPNKMQNNIDEMISEYDKSDFEMVSFVSPKNKNVNIVQFVLKTESIKADDKKTIEEEEKVKQGFWNRFLSLFRKNN